MSGDNPYSANEAYAPGTEKVLAITAHLLAIPFEFFAPLIGYLVLNNKGPFISHHVRESINFSITMLLLVAVLVVSIVGWVLLWVPPVIWFIFRVVAAFKASQGEFYKYPLTLRFIKG